MKARGFALAMAAFAVCALFATPADKGVYQWGVEVDGVVSRETKAPPRAYLWIPEACKELKAVVISNDNMLEEPLFSEPSFRKNLAEADCGIIFVTPGFQGMNERFDLEKDKPIVAALLKKLADESGYSELKDKTLLAPLGHSAWSDWGYFIANAFPERTACAVSLKGSWPHMKGRFFDDAFAARLKGIPLLLVSGEYEGPIADNKARSSALAAKWGIDLRIECDWRSGHFEYSPELRDFLGRWIRDGVQKRGNAYTNGGEWPQSMPDGEFALLGFRGKDGEEIAQNPRDHLQITIPTMQVGERGDELKVVPCFGTVVPPGRPERWTGKKAGDAADKPDAPESAIDWFVVQGPGVKTAQDKVAIRFNRHGFAGYRAREIVLAAVYQGDGKFKRSTQQAMLRFPLKAREGEVAEPNGWFVREGSATVDDAGSITWLPLPPRARKPHNATLCKYASSKDGELVYSLETIQLPE